MNASRRKCGPRRPAATVPRDEIVKALRMRVVTGDIVASARALLWLTQVQLGAEIDIAPETLSRWEQDHAPVPRTVQLALLGLLLDRLSAPKSNKGNS